MDHNNSIRNAMLSRASEAITEKDLEVEISSIERLGLQWADENQKASLLEETKKTFLAQITQELLSASRVKERKSMSYAQAENEALSDVRYEAHIREMTEARRIANRTRVQHDTAKVRLEMIRTLMANRREEMKLGGIAR